MQKYDVIILGAGAAGLMCAITAAKRGRSVLVLERSNKVGKKILMSGGGRCNFTNLYVTPDNYLSNNPHFCKSALSRYTPWDFITLVQQHKIPYHEKTQGQLFCDRSSKDIVNMLLDECKQAGVDIITQCETTKIYQQYDLSTTRGRYSATSLVIATGALSIPSLGGSDYGYKIAEQFGLSLLPKRAGLVPFTFTDNMKAITDELSGLSLTVTLSNKRASFTDDILFTHRGLSGPSVLQLSSYWQAGEKIYMNLLPGQDAYEVLITAKREHAKSLLRNFLSQRLPKKLVLRLETLYWPQHANTPLAEIANEVLTQIAHTLANWALKPAGTEGYRTAEVTLGGVDTQHLSSKTMACLTNPSLYFIGEVVDVTGHLGGFNFQWAWASGVAAGLDC